VRGEGEVVERRVAGALQEPGGVRDRVAVLVGAAQPQDWAVVVLGQVREACAAGTGLCFDDPPAAEVDERVLVARGLP